MDCKDDKIVYIFREMNINKKNNKKKDLEILIYDFDVEL